MTLSDQMIAAGYIERPPYPEHRPRWRRWGARAFWWITGAEIVLMTASFALTQWR